MHAHHVLLLLAALWCCSAQPTDTPTPDPSSPSSTQLYTTSPLLSTPSPSPSLSSVVTSPPSTTHISPPPASPIPSKVIIIVAGSLAATTGAPPPPTVPPNPDIARAMGNYSADDRLPSDQRYLYLVGFMDTDTAIEISCGDLPWLSYSYKDRREVVLNFYILLDTDGALTQQLTSLLNTRGGSNVVSATSSLATIPSDPRDSGPASCNFPAGVSAPLIITIVASIFGGVLLILFVILAYYYFKNRKSLSQQAYTQMGPGA